MKTLFWLIAGAIGSKIINDTLPAKMGLKELWGYGKRATQYITVMSLLFVVWLKAITMSKQQAAQREQQMMIGILCILVIAAICIMKLKQIQREQNKLNPPTA